MAGASYAVVVSFRVQREHAAEFARLVLANARTSLADEPGCRVFDVCRSADEEGLFLLYEIYADAAAFQEHLAAKHFREFDRLVSPWVLAKNVQALERLSA